MTELRADCGRCSGLCCVAPAFARSVDFAIDKTAGSPCPNLAGDFRCAIHDRLRPEGFRGCTVYDCFGAGQHVTEAVFPTTDWQRSPEVREQVFAVFGVVQGLHELLWYVGQAARMPAAVSLRSQVEAARRRVESLVRSDVAELAGLDVDAQRAEVAELLGAVAQLARSAARPGGPDLRRADLAGHDLRQLDFRGATLRGASLIAADVRGAVLDGTEVLGADLRDADLRGADLRGAVFATRPQVHAARGDGTTVLPDDIEPPAHWATS